MNYNTLKTSVAAVIKENGNNEITGDILQQTLIAMINSLGVGYQFMGVAQPSTNPGAPDQRVFYIAAEPGTYTGFNTEVVPGEIAIFKFSNTWLKDSIFAIDLANVGFKGVFESGIGLNPSDGETIVDVNYDASDYIPVGPGCVIVYSGGETDSNRAAIIGYDEDKYMVSVLLAGGSDWKNKIVAITDPDIKYVRVSSCNQNHENYNTPFAFNVVATTDVLVKVQELIEDVELLSERIQQIDPVINVIRNGYTFKGIALPNETLTEDVVSTFYWIETAGTYPGGVLAANEVGLLVWDGTEWTIEKLNLAKATALETTNIALTALASNVNQLGQEVLNSGIFVKGKYIEASRIENNYYLATDGSVVSHPESVVKTFQITGHKCVYITGRQGLYTNSWALACAYDSSDNLLKAYVLAPSTNYNDYPIFLPAETAYIKVCSSYTPSQPNVKCAKSELNANYQFFYGYENSVELQSGTDLNDVREFGVYHFSNDISQTIDNIPMTGGGYLIVSHSSPSLNDAVKQTIIFGLGHTYNRYYINISLGWTKWNTEGITYDLSRSNSIAIAENTNLNNIHTYGMYSFTSAVSQTLSNIPITGGGKLIVEYTTPSGNDNIYVKQTLIFGVCKTYTRYFGGSPNVWTEWVCLEDINNSVKALQNAVPEYWRTYLNSKIGTINEKVYGIGGAGDNFVFITDIHEDYNNGVSSELIKCILDKTSIRNIVIGGDLFTSAATQAAALAYLQGVKNKYNFTDRVFAIRGNHDSDNSITEGQYYSIFDRPLENILTTLEAGKSYFYRDNVAQKIRYIFCDCPNYNAAMPNDQITWLQQCITELSVGWTVVVFAHAYWNATTIGSPEQITAYGTSLRTAISNVAGTANATVAALIVGHTHMDRSEQTSTGYWIISTTCDAGGSLASNYDPVTPNRTPGTTLEQVFDVFNINTNTRMIYATRIGGNGTDRQFGY